MTNRKYNTEIVKKIFKEQGCELISKEYITYSNHLEYKCKCGNKSTITFANFQKGKRCKKCAGLETFTFEQVKLKFEERECILISTDYKNTKSKLEYICKCGTSHEMTYENFKKGSNCPNCMNKVGNTKFTYEHVYNYFKEQKCELISTEYINPRTKLDYICNCGNISSITFDHFKRGVRCMKCKAKHSSSLYSLSFDFIKEEFEKNNCKLLSTEYINCDTKLNYICNCGNKSKISYDSFRRGSRCNMCKNKTEKIVSEFLESKYTNIISQPKFEWCKNKTFLPFDFLLDNEKVIIEVDGGQHFKQVSNWKSPEETQKGDLFKMKCALEHGYHIIRIFQEDIFNNTIDWKFLITQAIDNLNIVVGARKPRVIYISKDPQLYNNYKLLEKLDKSL